jgi:hypothetical protein
MKQSNDNVIWQTQCHLYKSLKNSKKFAADKVQVFHQVPKNVPFPYIYLGKFLVADRSLSTSHRLQLYNDIHLYSQNSSMQEILAWADEITTCLTQRDIFLPTCHIGEIRFIQMELDVMNDAKTYRVISKFKSLLEEIYEIPVIKEGV